jgi:hypothetical protein
MIFTQFAFLGHGASHRRSDFRTTNDRIGRMLTTVLVGISYSWWMSNTRAASPNKIDKDPRSRLTPSPSSRRTLPPEGCDGMDHPAAGISVLPAAVARGNQAAPDLNPGAVRAAPGGRPLAGAQRAGRLGSGAIWRCSSGSCRRAWHSRFWAYNSPCSALCASFAPNHVGMPIVPRDAKLDFLNKQGAHLTQRRWPLVGHGADGRTQLPDGTPPVPEHAATAPEQGALACARALPVERRAVHRNVPDHRLGHRGPLSQSGRSRRSRLVPVPDRRAAARSITLTLAASAHATTSYG